MGDATSLGTGGPQWAAVGTDGEARCMHVAPQQDLSPKPKPKPRPKPKPKPNQARCVPAPQQDLTDGR